jgi:periplasmic protein TonB
MTAQQILKADLLDILFENRNKEYGAYKLRREYPSHLKKAVGLMLMMVVALMLYSMIKPPSRNGGIIPMHDTTIVVLEDIKDTKKDKPLQEQPQRTVEKAPPTRENPIFKIVPDEKVTKPLAETTDTSDMAIGPVANPGNGGEGTVAGTESTQTVITPAVQPEEPKEKTLYDANEVSEAPYFPGGDDAWLNYLQRMLRVPDELENGDRKTVRVKFIVNVDGAITNVEVIQSAGSAFDREVLRVINRMPKWKPGKQRGKPVAVYFTQPVTFAGEEE